MLSPTQNERIAIVEDICRSPAFSGTRWAAPLLRYLVQHPGVEGQAERTSEAIFDAVFFKIPKSPPYDINSVRGRISQLRGYLDHFYGTESGRHAPWRVSLPRKRPGRDASADHWDLRFEINVAPGGVAIAHVPRVDGEMLRFWEGFLAAGAPTRLIYGEPMFYRDADRSRFTRDVRRNYPKQLRRGEHAEYAFVTLGDLRFLLEVMRFLSARSVRVDTLGCLHESHIDFIDTNVHTADRENLIVIGTPRSNGALSVYQHGDVFLPFIVTEDSVVVRGEHLHDSVHPEKHGVVLAHAVLTRRRSLRSTGSVLLVASNHGRAIQKIGEILTSPDLFIEFLAKPGLTSFGGHLPPYFQILMRFETSDQGRFVNSYEILEAWDGAA